MATMTRRIAGLTVAVLLGLLAASFGATGAPPASAQPMPKVHRIGFLHETSPPPQGFPPGLEAFRQGLRDLGYAEGQNLTIEWRWAHGDPNRAAELAAELVRQEVDLIVTMGSWAPNVVQKATRTIPIVFAIVADPVGEGLVASLTRPGGNLTGLTPMSPDLIGKQLELLKEAVPRLSRVAVLRNPFSHGHTLQVKQADEAARTLGLRLAVVEAGGADALDSAFRRIAAERVVGALVLRDGVFFQHRARIAHLAAKAALPTMFGHREEVEAGGLMGYGANVQALTRRAAVFVDKILKGAKPADLPVEQATAFELIINLGTAKALGLTIPQSVLIRADQVTQ